MVNGDEGKAPRQAQSLGRGQPYEQGANESRTRRDRDGVDTRLDHGTTRFVQGGFDDGFHQFEVSSASNLRDNATEGLMERYLARNH
jgi:hypothetical protein